MDEQRFDRLVRAFSAGTSRRQVVGFLAASAAFGFGARRQVAAQATCAEGQTDCGGVCVDTCCNNEHCGACGNACPAGTTCFEGVCDCPSGLCCAEGEVQCDGECVATCCNNNHCGACGNACPPGLTCFEGVCDCPSGDCPPVEPPNTGAGPAGSAAHPGPWLAIALASAAAAVATRWSGPRRQT